MKPTLLFCVCVFLYLFGYSSTAFSQWIQVPNPLGVYCLATHGPDVFAGSFDTCGVWVSTDNGASWSPRGDKNFVGVYSLTFLGSIAFAGTYEKGVWRSDDLGKSWRAANTGITAQDIYGLAAIGSHLVAIGLGGIFQSNDSGTTWKRTSDKYAFESSATPLAVGGGNVYAATVSGLLHSTDNGGSWVSVLDSMCLAVAAEGPNVYTSNDSGFFRSVDNGNSWSKTSEDIYGLIYTNGKNIFAGPSRANDVTCYVSTDFGAHWTDLNQNSRSTSLVVSGPNIVKGSNNTGIWYRPLSDFLSVESNMKGQDLTLSLSPNPTTGILAIHSSNENILHISISNLLGESVLELVHPNAPEFTLDLSKLPPGIYITRLILPSEVITRKIVKQ